MNHVFSKLRADGIIGISTEYSNRSGKDIHPNDSTGSVWVDFKLLRRVIEEHGNPVENIKLE